MTLVTRVSLFFLVALAIGLGGYSLLGYALIRYHLYREFDGQLRSGFSIIVAAVEVEEDSVKWQPTEHNITIGEKSVAKDVNWIIVDHNGRVVDSSGEFEGVFESNQQLVDFVRQLEIDDQSQYEPEGTIERREWRLMYNQIFAPKPKPPKEMDSDEFPELTVIVARGTKQLHANLRNLAWLFGLLFGLLWVAGALLCRFYCRRALSPLTAMAQQVQETKADFNMRLPVSAPRDELSDLSLAFNQLMDELQVAFKKQERFTGDAAHQLRTPLTVLRGEIDVTLRRPRQPEEYQQSLVTLKEQAARLHQIVESLLFLARADGEATVGQREEIDLPEWWTRYFHRWHEHPRFDDFQYSIMPGATVLASPPLLEQALDNLLENAVKYSQPGTPISIVALCEGQSVAIHVEDQGAGIPVAEREAIFEPFYRSPSARQSGTEGIGLGLALVARIAKALSGNVRCEPASSRGSCFVLTLPARNM